MLSWSHYFSAIPFYEEVGLVEEIKKAENSEYSENIIIILLLPVSNYVIYDDRLGN